MHARDTPSRPRRNTSRPALDVGALNSTTSAVLFGDGPDASPARRVDVGVDGWTPKMIKEVVLTPAHIRRARTFDPTTDRSELQEQSSGTPTGSARRRRRSSPAATKQAYQLNIACEHPPAPCALRPCPSLDTAVADCVTPRVAVNGGPPRTRFCCDQRRGTAGRGASFLRPDLPVNCAARPRSIGSLRVG